MNSVGGIFVGLALMFGGGYALDKIYLTVKRAAVERIQKGQPSLMSFTTMLTCAEISVADGKLRPIKNCRSRP